MNTLADLLAKHDLLSCSQQFQALVPKLNVASSSLVTRFQDGGAVPTMIDSAKRSGVQPWGWLTERGLNLEVLKGHLRVQTPSVLMSLDEATRINARATVSK